eukprot:231014-Prorocentrum_minimum.AAC.1
MAGGWTRTVVTCKCTTKRRFTSHHPWHTWGTGGMWKVEGVQSLNSVKSFVSQKVTPALSSKVYRKNFEWGSYRISSCRILRAARIVPTALHDDNAGDDRLNSQHSATDNFKKKQA